MGLRIGTLTNYTQGQLIQAGESQDQLAPLSYPVHRAVKPQPIAMTVNDSADVRAAVPNGDASTAPSVVQTPIAHPVDTAKPEPPAKLTPDQQAKYETVLKTVSSWTTVPTTADKNARSEPITDDERMWLTRECLLRYLRATKWNVFEAEARLQRTLTWRREYGMEKLTPEYISIENETGKQVIMGYDIHGRPCLYLLPSNQNTEKSERQIEHLVFMLERVIDLMGPDQETVALLVNFKETKSGQNATIGQAKQTLDILQNHYPERLGRSLVTNGERNARFDSGALTYLYSSQFPSSFGGSSS